MSKQQIYSGKMIFYDNLSVSDINIEDIAHSLALQCRFNGHCKQFYSVAEHCVLMALSAGKYQLEILLHDAAEAYIGDIISPVKQYIDCTKLKVLEHNLNQVIRTKFNLENNSDVQNLIRYYDLRMLRTEQLQAMASGEQWGIENVEPLNVEILFYSPESAEKLFLDMYEKTKRED